MTEIVHDPLTDQFSIRVPESIEKEIIAIQQKTGATRTKVVVHLLKLAIQLTDE